MIVPVVYFYSTPGFSPSASKLSSGYRRLFVGTSALWKLAPGYKLGFKKKTSWTPETNKGEILAKEHF